jgi:2-amino-4-hydroxy-6-hydroxymethyldihydropteridine diphosphokinase
MNPGRRVVIALGSNLGDSRMLLPKAIERLRSLSTEPPLISSLYATAPVDCPPGSPDFLNAVVIISPFPGERPETLLGKLRALEKEFGRKPKSVLNEPRPLDLDLIAFGDHIRSGPALILPHPRAHQRRFVLAPLSEIAPGLVLPGQNLTVRQLLEALSSGVQPIRKI